MSPSQEPVELHIVSDAAEAPASSLGVKGPPRVTPWRWAIWYTALAVALVVFYGLFTPVWFGLRSLAWLAEFRTRRRRRAW